MRGSCKYVLSCNANALYAPALTFTTNIGRHAPSADVPRRRKGTPQISRKSAAYRSADFRRRVGGSRDGDDRRNAIDRIEIGFPGGKRDAISKLPPTPRLNVAMGRPTESLSPLNRRYRSPLRIFVSKDRTRSRLISIAVFILAVFDERKNVSVRQERNATVLRIEC